MPTRSYSSRLFRKLLAGKFDYGITDPQGRSYARGSRKTLPMIGDDRAESNGAEMDNDFECQASAGMSPRNSCNLWKLLYRCSSIPKISAAFLPIGFPPEGST